MGIVTPNILFHDDTILAQLFLYKYDLLGTAYNENILQGLEGTP